MAIHIQSGKNSLDCSIKHSKVHSVPFRIHADCDAPVSRYFEPYVKETQGNVLKGSFRGYPLRGQKIAIPDGYIGLMLHENIRPTIKKSERKFYIVNNFNEIVYWNWDKMPSRNDAFIKALDWIEISEALHSPITEE
ncbi:ribonuclease H2 subunit C [Cylas formicarius]|uniref:ribonuclease H2 subunit C n=1 Tax=Cylas formicarius TaxID=197179 RepID=UPI0029583B4C|nr:ribonuclease H2 subunit C [Cylas formicarius]